MRHVGLIGVGFIGKLFVDDIERANRPLTVYDVDPEQMQYAIDRGANGADSPAAVADAADVVVLSVPGGPEVESVMDGEEGLLDALEPGQFVIDTTTTGPGVAETYDRKCADRDVGYLTAPLTRGAADPGIHMMVGGTEAAYDEAEEILDLLSAAHTRIGDPAAAQTFKLAIQLRYAGHEAVDAEVVSFCEDSGVNPEPMIDFLGFDLDDRYLEKDFSPSIEGMGGLRIWYKDIGYALEVAKERGTALPIASTLHEAYKHAVRTADDDERDASTLIRYWQRLNDR